MWRINFSPKNNTVIPNMVSHAKLGKTQANKTYLRGEGCWWRHLGNKRAWVRHSICRRKWSYYPDSQATWIGSREWTSSLHLSQSLRSKLREYSQNWSGQRKNCFQRFVRAPYVFYQWCLFSSPLHKVWRNFQRTRVESFLGDINNISLDLRWLVVDYITVDWCCVSHPLPSDIDMS